MGQTVELFCGQEKAFSNIAAALDYRTLTVDLDPVVCPNLVADIRALSNRELPESPLIVWASPPDAAAFHDPESWEKDGSFFPINPAAQQAIDVYRATIAIITEMKPKWWFIENPKSLLRKMPITAGFNRGYPSRIRHSLRHDQYGGNGSGETDVWTNAYWWIPKPSDADSNEEVPKRRRVPPTVFAEIFGQLEQHISAEPAAKAK